MKLLMLFGLLSVVGLATSASTGRGRGCIWFMGICHECEEGTHAYTTRCDSVIPQATCDQPNPVAKQIKACDDYSACYCDEPTVRDIWSGKCVPLDQCPKKTNEEGKA